MQPDETTGLWGEPGKKLIGSQMNVGEGEELSHYGLALCSSHKIKQYRKLVQDR